jgi:hypothetical protein
MDMPVNLPVPPQRHPFAKSPYEHDGEWLPLFQCMRIVCLLGEPRRMDSFS